MGTDEQKFIALLKKYLENRTSPGELQELMGMIKSGLYDPLLKQRIDFSLRMEELDQAERSGHPRPVEQDITLEKAHHLLQKILSSEEQTAQLIPAAKKPVSIGRWLTAAAVLLLIVTGWWYWHQPAVTTLAKVESKSLEKQADTGKGTFVRLPDGSTVLLNHGSKLDYGAAFNGKTREVKLTGEAYFDIRQDNKRPFIVHARKVTTTVLGTAFNIRAYPGQPEVVVTVSRGKVKVSDPKKTYGILTSNQQITVSMDREGYSQGAVNAESIVAWKKDYLILDDISLEEASHLIEDKYHIHFILTNEEMKKCRISATFLSHENLEQVLNVVCGVVGAMYKIQPNDQVVIDGKGCN